MYSHQIAIRVSSRSKRPVEKYSDLAVSRKKKAREGAGHVYGWRFFDQLTKAGKAKEDFSPPSDWIKDNSRIPAFRQLKQNLYRAPLCRPCWDDDSILVCDCIEKGNICGSQCHNRMTYVECVPEYCQNSSTPNGACENTAITLQRFPKTEVFKTADRGYGLRLLDAVSADTIVAEYMGEVISNDEMWRRMRTYEATDDFYFANLGGGLTLDASSMGSLARFANHSCDPTCIMQRWTVKGEPRIVLTALRNLPAGSEITYCYNFEDDDFANNPVKHQVCRCGAKHCSGKVGKGANTRDADIQALVDKAKGYIEGNKSATLEVLMELLAQIQEHQGSHEMLVSIGESLPSIVSQANTWIEECQNLMVTAKTQLIDVTSVTSLLERAPACLRSDYKKQLKAMSAALEEAQGFFLKLRANTLVNWDDFVELCRLLNSAHPLNCKDAVDYLFSIYLPSVRWCIENVVPFTSCLEEITHKTTGEGLGQHRSNYYSMLRKLLKAYYEDCTLPPDWLTFSVTQLNERLSDFMTAQNKLKIKAKKGEEEEADIAVCYCQTLESCGDHTVCVQCSSCDQWYHPACMNFPAAYASSMRKQDSFYCASCSFRVGLLSNFVFSPVTEWASVKLKKKAIQSAASNTNDIKSSSFSVQSVLPAQEPDPDPTTGSDEGVQLLDKAEDPSSAAAPAAIIVPAPVNPLLLALDRLALQGQNVQLKQYLKKEDISAALRQAEALQLRYNPVSELLLLSKKFVGEWESEVAAFFSDYMDSVVVALEKVLHDKTVGYDDVCSLSSHLQHILGLYFKLSQLRIKPSMIKALRVWIWTISVVPYVLTCFGYDFSPASNLPGFEQSNLYDRALSLSDLKKMIAAGNSMVSDLPDALVIHGKHLNSHKKVVVRVISALENAASAGASLISQCKLCNTAEGARELQQRTTAISRYLIFQREFYYARLMNLLVVPKITNEGTEECQVQDVYCWCRQGEQLAGQMIYCESCNEWFHYPCMGLHSSRKGNIHGLVTTLSHSWCMLDSNREKRSLRKLKDEDDFLCIRCSEEKGLSFPYAW
eukprot:gene30697-37092_t